MTRISTWFALIVLLTAVIAVRAATSKTHLARPAPLTLVHLERYLYEKEGPYPDSLPIVFDKERGVYMFTYRDQEYLWRPPTDVDVTVTARTEPDQNEACYLYLYSLSSLASSRQNTHEIDISCRYPVSRIMSPEGWIDLLSDYSGEPARVWTCISEEAGLGLGPGCSRSGFGFSSYALPGIVDCYAAGNRWMNTVTPGDIPVSCPDGIWVELNRFDRTHLRGRTLGPVGSPDLDTPIGVVERLTAYLTEANELGWLGTGDVVEFLKARLNASASFFRTGRITEARQQLQEVIAYLNRGLESGEIEPEGADLFILNARWAVGRTEEGHPPHYLAPSYIAPLPVGGSDPIEYLGYTYEVVGQCVSLGWVDNQCPANQKQLNLLAGELCPAFRERDFAYVHIILDRLRERIQNCAMPSDTAQYGAKNLVSTISEIQKVLKKRQP